MGIAFAPVGFWPAAILGAGALTWLTTGTTGPRASLTGFAAGLTLNAVTISWVGVLGWYVGVALVIVMALWTALLGFILHRVSRLPAAPLWCATAWVAVEFCASNFPFGGFGWNRLGFTVLDQPIAGYVPWLGVTGATLVVALVGNLTLVLIAGTRPRAWVALAVVGLFAGGPLLGWLSATLAPQATGSVQVGIVQGDVNTFGRRDLGPSMAITNNHLSETITLLAKAEGQRPDFFLWPESSTDRDPLLHVQTRAVVETAVQLAEVPILLGTVTYGPGEDERQTTAIWWDPELGPTATYHKRNVVPFGEWVPFRDFLLPIFEELADTGRQSVPGEEPGIFEVPTANGLVTIGDVICYDLAFDATVAQTVTSGGEMLVVQSNNAYYTGTWQTAQQFEMTRVRALETGRYIAVATTNSYSGVIDRNGQVLSVSVEGEPASEVATIPTFDDITLAVWIRPALNFALVTAAAAGVGLSYLGRFRRVTR